MNRPHLLRHLPRHLPLHRTMHFHMPERITGRLRPFEPVLRPCQLVLIVLLAVLGAQWLAKGVVLAGTALMTWLH